MGIDSSPDLVKGLNSLGLYEEASVPLAKEPSRAVGKISYDIFNSDVAGLALRASVAITFSAILLTASILFLPTLPIIVPIIISLAGLTLVAMNAIKIRKKLLFEISFLYTVKTGGHDWWTPITPNIILGAMPLESHMTRLKNDHNVTHVLTMVEDFERMPCLIRPASKEVLEKNKFVNEIKAAHDFAGVPPDTIYKSVEFMREVITNESTAKVYVHCKAGRGRSATVVVAYLLKYGHGDRKFENFGEAYQFVKGLRPQINLNPRQQATIEKYWQSHCQ